MMKSTEILYWFIFNLVSATIPLSSNSKLSHYECFILTIMKLRLNLNNYDFAFCFSVSTYCITVGRVFSRWIGAVDVCLSPLVRWPERESVQAKNNALLLSTPLWFTSNIYH